MMLGNLQLMMRSRLQHYINICYNRQLSRVVLFDNIKVVKPIYHHDHHQPHLIPDKVSNDLRQISSQFDGHLKWMATKYVLKQDIFLIGSAGSLRRKLIYLFCRLIRTEVELFVITRDTIEADLRQRKEIIDNGKSTFYADSCIVKAAIHGRVLILDGIEKAERNVLPTLNNLLENREMPLDDGRCLLSPQKYDALVKEIGLEEMNRRRLERVSENFQIVALGLPVPPYVGHALDPPLRSRFQGRVVDVPIDLMGLDRIRVDNYHMSYDSMEGITKQLEALYYLTRRLTDLHTIPRLPYDSLIRLKNVLYQRINSITTKTKTNDKTVVGGKSHQHTQTIDVKTLQRYYPFHLFDNATMQRVQSALGHMGIEASIDIHPASTTSSISTSTSDAVVMTSNGYVETTEIRQLMSNVIEDWQVGHDICIIGDSGGGKTAFITRLLSSIQRGSILTSSSSPNTSATTTTTNIIAKNNDEVEVESMFLYQDMSARDLIEHRSTDTGGNTTWSPSSVVRAAMEGKVLVLDGIDRLSSDALCILAPLIQDRRLTLSGLYCTVLYHYHRHRVSL